MSKPGESEIEKLERLVAAPKKWVATLTWYEVATGDDGEEHATMRREKKTFWISEVNTGDIPALLRAAGPLLPLLTDRAMDIQPVKLLMLHPDQCLNVLSVLTRTERAVIDKLALTDSAALLEICIEANLSFFVRNVLPLLSGGLARLTAQAQDVAKKLAGPTQPPT